MTKLQLVREEKIKENNDFNGPTVDVHPDSIRYLNLGHPWIIEDSYTKKFPTNIRFFETPVGPNESYVLMNLPSTTKVKARVIGKKSELVGDWQQEIKRRLQLAYEKRQKLITSKRRENYYLVFSENDGLPGLNLLILKDICVIQLTHPYWETQVEFLEAQVKKLPNFEEVQFIHEFRYKNAKSSMTDLKEVKEKEIVINEFGLKYLVKLDGTKDYGLFTDMSAMRLGLRSYFENCRSFLNLFCFTGAFSLFALEQGTKRAVSVDLSHDHLDWLKENMELNEHLLDRDHRLVKDNVLRFLQKSHEQFDLILVDPPTLITSGKKTLNTMQFYKQSLLELTRAVTPGGHIIVFCHIKNQTMRQIKNKLNQTIKTQKLRLSFKRELTLSEDCKPKRGFPEGSYLKCLVYKKTQ